MEAILSGIAIRLIACFSTLYDALRRVSVPCPPLARPLHKRARMPARTAAKSRSKPVAKSKSVIKAKRPPVSALPEWNLADLYPAIDSPEVKRDFEKADAECVAFEEA